MSYATAADFRAWVGYLADTIDLPEDGSDDAIDRLLQRASNDVSTFLCFPVLPDPPDPGTPLEPDRIQGLTRYEAQALSTATIAQAVYRLIRIESELSEGVPSITNAGGVTFASSAPPMLGPETLYALSACPVLWWNRSGTVEPDPTSPDPVPDADQSAV